MNQHLNIGLFNYKMSKTEFFFHHEKKLNYKLKQLGRLQSISTGTAGDFFKLEEKIIVNIKLYSPKITFRM